MANFCLRCQSITGSQSADQQKIRETDGRRHSHTSISILGVGQAKNLPCYFISSQLKKIMR